MDELKELDTYPCIECGKLIIFSDARCNNCTEAYWDGVETFWAIVNVTRVALFALWSEREGVIAWGHRDEETTHFEVGGIRSE